MGAEAKSYEFRGLDDTDLLSHGSVSQKSSLPGLASHLQVSQGRSQGVSQLGSYQEAVGRLPSQALRTVEYSPEVPVPVLTVSSTGPVGQLTQGERHPS